MAQHVSVGLGQRFQQTVHALHCMNMAQDPERRQTLLDRREPLAPKKMRDWVRAFGDTAGPIRRDSVDYVVHCLETLPKLVSFDKQFFKAVYEKLLSIAPAEPSLILPGLDGGGPLVPTRFTPGMERAIAEYYRVEYNNWSTSGFGSIQGISKARGHHADRVTLQCTGTAVCHTDDSDLWEMGLGSFDAAIQGRLVGCGVLALVYEDLMDADAHMTIKQVCTNIIATHFADDKWTATQPGQGPCSSAANYRLNWMPFSEDEAKYIAFGQKVAVDYLSAVRRAIQLSVPGSENFAVPAAYPTNLVAEGPPVATLGAPQLDPIDFGTSDSGDEDSEDGSEDGSGQSETTMDTADSDSD